MTEIDDEMLALAMADYMLTGVATFPDVCLGAWRRAAIGGDWSKRLPLYLWITVKTA